MNAATLDALRMRHAVRYVGPIDPPVERWRKGISKVVRILGGGGDFFFYSSTRLKAVAAEVSARCQGDAQIDFFLGFTPWIDVRSGRSYIAWSDCIFRDYIDIYHRRSDFRATDLTRIEVMEAEWMRGARRLGFSSAWSADRAVRAYGLDPERVVVFGIFGEVEPPEVDLYEGSSQFAFVSTNFEAKGGPVVVAAFDLVRKRHPDARLVVVGDAPKNLGTVPGVTATGVLHKEDPNQSRRLCDILGRSRAVVHPTRSDIAPLLAVEAGYFGCPVISTRGFAIPEIVEDGRTGLLLDDPTDTDAVAAAMNWMLEASTGYAVMRCKAWEKSRDMYSKERFEERLLACVDAALNEAATMVG